jgi:hypothetical protein
MLLPIRRIDTLYHWGSLKPENLGENGASWEGNCLSASLCPEAWLGIAKLGNNPLHAMTANGGVFVDLYALVLSAEFSEQRTALIQALEGADMMTLKKVYRLLDTNEDGDVVSSLYPTLDEAESEAMARTGDLDEAEIEETQRYVPSDEVARFLGITADAALVDGLNYAVMAWIRQQVIAGAQIDGVYMNDNFDPLAYSAPVFAVFPERVARWSFSPSRMIEDDEVLMDALLDATIEHFTLK